MYTQCLLLLAALMSAALPMSTQGCHATSTSGVTIVERLRSELLRVLYNEALAAEDVSLPATPVSPCLTRTHRARPADADSSTDSSAGEYVATRAIDDPDGLFGQRPTLRRGSGCWWLWVLFGVELCVGPARLT